MAGFWSAVDIHPWNGVHHHRDEHTNGCAADARFDGLGVSSILRLKPDSVVCHVPILALVWREHTFICPPLACFVLHSNI